MMHMSEEYGCNMYELLSYVSGERSAMKVRMPRH